MGDSYEINSRGEVVPYSGGRMATDTRTWREATELELQQRHEIERLEAVNADLLGALESLFNMADIAIRSGDWTVDGARDPDMILVRADKALQRARGESND